MWVGTSNPPEKNVKKDAVTIHKTGCSIARTLLSRAGDALRVLVTMTRLAKWRGRQVQVLSLRRASSGALENPAAGNEANGLVLLGEAGCGRGVG